MLRNGDDTLSRMKKDFELVCDTCGNTDSTEDEGRECDCGGIFVTDY